MTSRSKVVRDELAALSQTLSRQQGVVDSLKSQIESKQEEIESKKASVLELEKDREVLKRASTLAREVAKTAIEKACTRGLQSVHGSGYSLSIKINDKNRRSSAEFKILSPSENGIEENNVLEDRGGGVLDVVSLLARMAYLEMQSDPPNQGPLFLDEPGKAVSLDNTAALAEVMKEIAREYNRQLIVITHNEDLASLADTAFRVQLVRGKSQVTPLSKT